MQSPAPSPTAPTQPARVRNPPVLVLAVLLATLAAWVYSNSFSGVLVLDDIRAIARNPTIRTLWPLSTPLRPPTASTVAGRPVANLSFALNYALAPAGAREVFGPGGANAPPGTAGLFLLNIRGYHFLNLLIHLASGLALFGVVRRTLLSGRLRSRFEPSATGLAFAAAAVWLVHPLQTSAVTYVVQRVESLMGLFFLLTVYCAIRARDGTRRRAWAAGAIVSCALGMGTKEAMVTAPLVVALWDWIFSEQTDRRVRWGLVGGLASTWVVLAVILLREHRGPSINLSPDIIWQYLLTQTQVVTHYLRLAVTRSPLVFLYTWPLATSLSAVAAPAAFLGALAALSAVAVVRRIPAGFAGAWFFLILAPTSSVLPIVTEVAAEHRMYLPLAAVISCIVIAGWAGLGVLLRRFTGNARARGRTAAAVGAVVVAAAVIACGLETRARNRDYSNDERLWRDTVEKQPANQRALIAYGEVLANAGRLIEAEAVLRRAVEVDPSDQLSRVRLGAAQKSLDEAITLGERKVAERPDDAAAHRFLGRAYAARRQDALAVRHLERSFELVPDDAEALGQLATVLAESSDASIKDVTKAVAAAERLVQLTGRGDPGALEILAVAEDAAGRSLDATATAAEALRAARAQGDKALVSRLKQRLSFFESRAGIQPGR
jgi:tetratricopeptide (TPR) repeat protein